jgi:glyoxylase-like metal-dependent hydrolase (beta-lactamase superfamily II)
MSRFSRRSLLAGSATLAAAGLLDAPIQRAAVAKAPIANTQAPAFYRFKLGALEATVVSDGLIGPLGAPADLFKGATKEELEETLAENFLPQDKIVGEINTLVVNSGDRLVLFDTGMGSSKIFGPNTGRLGGSLRAAGFDPKEIDAVVITHAHPDHCWGCQREDGEPNFSNAQIYMTEADLTFWTDEGKLAQETIKAMVEGTRKALLPLRERISFIKDGEEILPGVQSISTPGHTVGHTSFLLTSAGQTLLIAGDVMNHHVLSVESPQLEFAFDTDPKQGVTTRKRVLDMLASQRLQFLAYHFPWPGIGNVTKEDDGFRYVPAPMRMVM